MHRLLGKKFENLAKNYLIQQGLTLITENFSCQFGEIDLIMKEQEVLIFVEVRYRKHNRYGCSLATVNKNKQAKIKRAVTYYLQQQKLFDKISCRFDIVAITKNPVYQFVWLKDAFWGKW